MKPLIAPLSLLALAALAACGQSKTETVNQTIGDPMANQLANAPVAELPPSLKSSKSYRCKDNSLVFIDLFDGDKLANVRTDKAAPPVKLTAPEAGKPLVAEGGYKLEGSGSTLTVTLPGKSAQACKA
ncbi:MAG TPA: hypothetical protein VF503_05825 [Sphingobium sp.]|uniref:hypothetical protein n=1 Tax=Sphingobium sp. TaxID=1912891 RepID=UPI002ED125C1